jgi:hypothetical protein
MKSILASRGHNQSRCPPETTVKDVRLEEIVLMTIIIQKSANMRGLNRNGGAHERIDCANNAICLFVCGGTAESFIIGLKLM